MLGLPRQQVTRGKRPLTRQKPTDSFRSIIGMPTQGTVPMSGLGSLHGMPSWEGTSANQHVVTFGSWQVLGKRLPARKLSILLSKASSHLQTFRPWHGLFVSTTRRAVDLTDWPAGHVFPLELDPPVKAFMCPASSNRRKAASPVNSRQRSGLCVKRLQCSIWGEQTADSCVPSHLLSAHARFAQSGSCYPREGHA